jgi:hypothetical protein
MEAVHSHQSSIEVRETVSYQDFVNSIEEDVLTSPRNTTTTYRFVNLGPDNNFFSLDTSEGQVSTRYIDDSGFHYCHDSSLPKVGDILIASEHQRLLMKESIFGHYMSSPRITRNKGFLLIRRVLSMSTLKPRPQSQLRTNEPMYPFSNEHCLEYKTEELHPIELFESFNIHSEIDHKYQTTYFPAPVDDVESSSTSPKHQNDLSNMAIAVPSPLISCADGYWSEDDYYYDDSFRMSYTGGWVCAQRELSLPGSFNYNYDFSTGRAIQNQIIFPNVVGMTCTNCYAFMGAYLTFHLEYSYSIGFGASVDLSGGAGANINLDVVNPVVSGSSTYTLIRAQESTSYLYVPVISGKLTQPLYFLSEFFKSFSNFCSLLFRVVHRDQIR